MARDKDSAPTEPAEITQWLAEWAAGDSEALRRIMPLVFNDLRRLAGAYMRHERPNHTMQATALVSEVFLRLESYRPEAWTHRRQFFAFAGRLMRQILIDYARHHRAERRGGGLDLQPISSQLKAAETVIEPETLLELHRALEQLEKLAPRQAEQAQLRYFLGLNLEQTASALGISKATAKRDWEKARAFLALRLKR